MPVDNKTIEGVTQLLRTAVEGATGWTTVIGPVQGPEPANQYCIITPMNEYKQPHDVINYTQTETKITEHQRSESTITFEVQARGYGAMQALDNFISYLDSELREIDLWPYVGSGGHDDTQNISTNGYHQGKMLEMAVVNVYINANLKKENELQWFNIVDIGIIKDNNVIASITVPEQEHNENGD